jgi:type VI secretion system secreted protein VgrG
LTRHFDDAEKGEYVITSVTHSASNSSYVSGGGGTEDYAMNFSCIPSGTVYRPPRVTPKPRIHSLQTAICVGRKGEEIDTDKYGRIKCQFFWDRRGKNDDKSSCWIRVAHPIAGKKWGTVDLPRIGHEVVVAFLDGDPDRPLVVGSVFNDWTMPPYDLPAHKTRWTTKTMSSKGGGGFNELRFEDKKGEEQIFISAERNQDNRVKNDSLEWIGNKRHLIVTADQLEKVEGDKHLTVTGDHNEKVNGTISVEAAMDMQEKVGMKHALDAGMEIHLKAGMNVVIEAGMSITLKAGGGFVVVGPTGVAISGTPVLINSGGSAQSGSGSSPQPPDEPELADEAEPGERVELPPPATPPSVVPFNPGPVQAETLRRAAETGTPFCEKCEAARRAAEQQQAEQQP